MGPKHGHRSYNFFLWLLSELKRGGDQGYNGIDDWNYVGGMGDLDECNGRWGPTPEYPEGTYYYVSTPLSGSTDLVTDTDGNDVAMIGFPYFLLCYHGVADVPAGGEAEAVAHQVAEAEAASWRCSNPNICTNIYLNYLNKQSMKKIPMVNKSQQQ